MRVLCCGDRHWGEQEGDRQLVVDRLFQLGFDTVLIHGGAKGADLMCAAVAAEMNARCGWRFLIEEFRAEWRRYGKAAGPMRNQRMLDANPDLVLAFHSDLAASKGTADMVRRARKLGVPVELIENKAPRTAGIIV